MIVADRNRLELPSLLARPVHMTMWRSEKLESARVLRAEAAASITEEARDSLLKAADQLDAEAGLRPAPHRAAGISKARITTADRITA